MTSWNFDFEKIYIYIYMYVKGGHIPHKIIKAADKNMESCQSSDGLDNE